MSPWISPMATTREGADAGGCAAARSHIRNSPRSRTSGRPREAVRSARMRFGPRSVAQSGLARFADAGAADPAPSWWDSGFDHAEDAVVDDLEHLHLPAIGARHADVDRPHQPVTA